MNKSRFNPSWCVKMSEGYWLNLYEKSQEELLAAQNELKVAKQRLANARQVNIELRQEVDNLTKEKESLTKHAEQWRNTSSRISDERDGLRAHNNMLQIELTDQTNSSIYWSEECDSLRGQVASLRGQVASLLKEKIDSLTDTEASFSIEIAELKQDNEHYRQYIGDLNADIARHLNTIDALRADVNDREGIIGELGKDIRCIVFIRSYKPDAFPLRDAKPDEVRLEITASMDQLVDVMARINTLFRDFGVPASVIVYTKESWNKLQELVQERKERFAKSS